MSEQLDKLKRLVAEHGDVASALKLDRSLVGVVNEFLAEQRQKFISAGRKVNRTSRLMQAANNLQAAIQAGRTLEQVLKIDPSSIVGVDHLIMLELSQVPEIAGDPEGPDLRPGDERYLHDPGNDPLVAARKARALAPPPPLRPVIVDPGTAAQARGSRRRMETSTTPVRAAVPVVGQPAPAPLPSDRHGSTERVVGLEVEHPLKGALRRFREGCID